MAGGGGGVRWPRMSNFRCTSAFRFGQLSLVLPSQPPAATAGSVTSVCVTSEKLLTSQSKGVPTCLHTYAGQAGCDTHTPANG